MNRLHAHLLFLVLTVAFSAPLLIHFGTPPVGAPYADPATTAWNFWWVGQVLAGEVGPGEGLFFTRQLFHPLGSSLVWHTGDLLPAILLAPLQALVGTSGQHALGLMLATWLMAWFTWEAARSVGASPVAAALASVALTVHGYRIAEAHHFNIFFTCFAPLTLLLLRRIDGAERGAGWALLLGVAGAAALLTSQFHALACALIAFGYTAMVLVVRDGAGRKRFLLRGVGAALVAMPVVVWLAVLMAHAPAPVAFGAADQARNAADLWQWLLHPRLRELFIDPEMMNPALGDRLLTWYLPGYLLAALGFAGLWRASGNRRLVAVLLSAAVVFGILGMGPLLKVGAPGVINPAASGIPLPGMLLRWVPGLGTMRSIWHFGFYGTLFLALAGALGWDRLRVLVPAGNQRLLVLATVAIVLAESWQMAIPSGRERLDESALVLAARPEPGAVIVLPTLLYEVRGHFMYQQTIHRRPIVGGYLSRDPQEFEQWRAERRWPLELDQIGIGRLKAVTPEGEAALREDIAEHGLRFMLIHDPGESRRYAPRVQREVARLGMGAVVYERDGDTIILISSQKDHEEALQGP